MFSDLSILGIWTLGHLGTLRPWPQVEAELAKPGGCFQGAPDSVTAPGVALAALFAPAVLPPEYSGKFAPETGQNALAMPEVRRWSSWMFSKMYNL